MWSLKIIAIIAPFFSFTSAITQAPPSGPPPKGPANNGKTCTVKALGNKKDDTPQILKAFKECNNGGTVVFPQNQNYWIATKLNPVVYDVTVDWKGTWTVCNFSISKSLETT
jgi:galacturan 1,4-alpha-galacturonidase